MNCLLLVFCLLTFKLLFRSFFPVHEVPFWGEGVEFGEKLVDMEFLASRQGSFFGIMSR